MNLNERAYDLLTWQSLLPPAPYDELFDYHALWEGFSNKALDEWDKQHPYVTSDELAAFHELERLKVYTQQDYYSPTKAQHGYYTRQLERVTATATATGSINLPSPPCRGDSQDGARERLAPDNAEQGLRAARPRRPKRH